MTRVTPSVLIPRLIQEFGYPRAGAELIAGKLINSCEIVWDSFWAWWQSGETPKIAVEGYSVASLAEKHSMKPIAAFLTLDWLTREPELAKASLHKGHDRVS